ncbi:MAG: aminomethyl-transferring glycine dehydrogenase [Candidatus Margulisiibacteriota bacterium]
MSKSASFVDRHIGPREAEVADMLSAIGVDSLADLISQTVPAGIRLTGELDLPEALSEDEALRHVRYLASKNKTYRSYIGQGYYGTVTPSVILRNIFENPGWYTQYTPYQAEISQGRLEALLNFQTVVADLTGLPVANASLLDEATAAAEAMTMLFRVRDRDQQQRNVCRFFVSETCFAQTIQVVQARAVPLGIHVEVGPMSGVPVSDDYFGYLFQTPDATGAIADWESLISTIHKAGAKVAVAVDLLCLCLFKSPGEIGADVAIGSSQRFGVPMGFGGPHAAFLTTKDDYKRQMPGRIIGVSVDRYGSPAYRMALQTREQHIRREKATSNICTAQALLAIMAGMYEVYHGPEGLRAIAERVHGYATQLAAALRQMGVSVADQPVFDTVFLTLLPETLEKVCEAAESHHINFNYRNNTQLTITLDETVTDTDFADILSVFEVAFAKSSHADLPITSWPTLKRRTEYLTHPAFHSHRSESQLMRYIKSLENKDLSLTTSMIALGSCTMKLNAATEMLPLSWLAFSGLHPFAPGGQTQGYADIFAFLERALSTITGLDACSLQPNSGAQGEYAGLMVMRAYHAAHGQPQRTVMLVPASAHGTNPASAAMAGFDVVIVGCDGDGNIDLADLTEKARAQADRLGGLMVTYPSTHGIFEENIRDICRTVHDHGGLVYMDGANMNAQVGLTSPGEVGADVCHLNLHKTFAIPHGGGGPGMGPICVRAPLAPFLPGHPRASVGGKSAILPVSAAPWGSASILLISYLYIRMLGRAGLRRATEIAILNANYIKARLTGAYPILFQGRQGHVAHELIIDCRGFKKTVGIEVEDMAKRLMDYGFHAPTMSWPVPGTLMIEPTESEDKAELDRFCDALLAIREEIAAIETGRSDVVDNPLKNAPHTMAECLGSDWKHAYSREVAAMPLPFVKARKFWPTVARIDNAYGDKNLVCTCPPVSDYALASFLVK